ncbi:MAG TPA: aminotransferase class IV, partial [Caulobacteraceae bacterium]|nr:aminotransferase class IV [Caulobacteraceae bacterium]
PAPRLFATASPAPLPQGQATLMTSTVRRNEGSPASRLKTLGYTDNVLARAEARAAGADEALMLNNRGEVACASAANVFWIRGARLFTPALACGVLSGITRARVLASAASAGLEPVEIAADPQNISGADAFFLANSLVGIRPVRVLDGVEIPQSPTVALLSGLQQSFAT